MRSGDTIKTTIRLPADLHWRFQTERAKRRLSNEKAISEAFAFWIEYVRLPKVRVSKESRADRSPLMPKNPDESECVETLLYLLRDNDNPAGAAAAKAVLAALSRLVSRGPERDKV
jgi:hypothetical protein